MSESYLKLADVGLQTQSGKHMGGHGEDGVGESKRSLGNVQDTFAHYQGMGGSRFQEVGALVSGNIALMAKDMFDQSVRAVKGEGHAINQDDEAHQAQATPLADNDSVGSMLRTNITV